MFTPPMKSTTLEYDPWSVKEKTETLRPGPRLEAIVACHYLGLRVMEWPEQRSSGAYFSQVPDWWVRGTNATPMTEIIPPYTTGGAEFLGEAMRLLDFAETYELTTFGRNGRTERVDCRVWFKTYGRQGVDEDEKVIGEGRAGPEDYPDAARQQSMMASALMGLAICRALMHAVREMSDQEYEIHCTNVRLTILRVSKEYADRRAIEQVLQGLQGSSSGC